MILWQCGISVGEGPSPLGSYSGKSGTYPGKLENTRANLKIKTFFRDHTNPMRKKEKILVKTFFLRSHYTFGNILF